MYTIRNNDLQTFPIEYIEENEYINYTNLFKRINNGKEFDDNYIKQNKPIQDLILTYDRLKFGYRKRTFTIDYMVKNKILIEFNECIFGPLYLLEYIITTNDPSKHQHVSQLKHLIEKRKLEKIHKDFEQQKHELTRLHECEKLKFESKIKDLSKENSDLSKENSDLSKENSDLSKVNSENEAKINKLNGNLKFVQVEHNKIKNRHKEEIDKLTSINKNQETKLQQKDKQITDLESSNQTKDKTINNLKSTVNNLENKDKESQTRITNLRSVNDKLSKSCINAENKIKDLSKENSDLSKVNSDLSKVNSENENKIKDLELIVSEQFEIINGFRSAANLLMGTMQQSKYKIRILSNNDKLYYQFGINLEPLNVGDIVEFEETIICSQFEFQSLVDRLIKNYNIQINTKHNYIKVDHDQKQKIIDEFKFELYKLNNQLSKPNPNYNTNNIQQSINELKEEVKELKDQVYSFTITQKQHNQLLTSLFKCKGRWRKIKEENGIYYVNYGRGDRERLDLPESAIKELIVE